MPTKHPTLTIHDVPEGASYLLVFDDRGSRRVPLPSAGIAVVGRTDECQIQLEDSSASRKHARIEVDDERVSIVDLGSRHGTRLNGQLIAPGPTLLASGDVVQLGRSSLVAHLASRRPDRADSLGRAEIENRLAGANERRSIGDRSVVVADPAMAKTYDLLERLAASDIAVLVVGETGAGKELAASALHAWSPRASGPLVAINCAALPETLIESELFGHEKGAFSGADRAKPGLVERAAGGTLFLDELVELPPAAQAKLLRALEQRVILRIGGLEPIAVDFRLVAATSRDVPAEIAAGRLREDLYYRVAAAVIEIPPLRDRLRDIVVLARTFLANARARAGSGPRELSDDALRALAAYRFPGNVRELANAIDFAFATTKGELIEPWNLPSAITRQATQSSAPSERRFLPITEEIAELERRRMLEALEAAGGNQSRAADLIGMPRRTFVTKSARYGLRRFGSEQ